MVVAIALTKNVMEFLTVKTELMKPTVSQSVNLLCNLRVKLTHFLVNGDGLWAGFLTARSSNFSLHLTHWDVYLQVSNRCTY
jgi:hypothetical protein